MTSRLVNFKNARGQNPALSPSRSAIPDSTSAASREAHSKPSATERNKPCPPWATGFPRRGVGGCRLRVECLFPEWKEEEDEMRQRRDKQQLEAACRAALVSSYPRSVPNPRVDYGFHSADSAIEVKDAIT
ncbi:hypothetical protein Plhal710r2_c017g0075181 [Plasmopara halstedii]